MTQDFQAGSGLGFDGISEGYRLIEQHIRRAREVATGAGKTPRRRKSNSVNDEDVRAVVAPIFRSLSELLPVLGDRFNRLGAEGVTRLLTSNTVRFSTEASAMADAGSRVRIEISSHRLADAKLELRANAEKLKLLVHPLIKGSSSSGAIKTLRFSPAKRGGTPILSIRIPVRQTPGTYAGAVVDSRSGEPKGVLTVHVRK